MLVYNNFEQRSPEWYQIREGKITASPILNILGKESLETTKNAIENLAMVLAIESVYGMVESDYVSFDMQRGIDLEPFAFNRLESILNESYIDLLVPISRPPTILKIRDFDNGCLIDRRLFTLGNFSAITGKSKSKKSFLASLFLAACAKNSIIDNKFIGCLPASKNGVLLFDTEQSSYDTYRYSKNVVHKINDTLQEIPSFVTFNLREYSPVERCEIIDFALTRYRDEVGYIVIDGIADLVNAINDEIEATRVITLLMKWTKQFNCHITVNIHQNKNDNFATGWIGSYILKKAECVISVNKDPTDSMRSKVECQDIRGTAEFKDFDIEIQENGLPLVSDLLSISNSYEVKEVPF